jgi:methyltransferase family protein
MLNIVTVNWHNYQNRGAEYVNNLFDMVRRNLEEGTEGRFICFTDDPDAGYRTGIETHPLPGNLDGWWNKIWLFKDGVLPKGERVLYLDLDTLIVGPIDALAAYRGKFGILADFYRPTGLQSSVMAWEAGSPSTTVVWDAFEAAGCPQSDPNGDQSWIERCRVPSRERLQVAFPDMFVSYKVSGAVLPAKASVVVFHGQPRPHEVTTGWVPKVWRVGGISHGELKTICNTAHEKLLANVRKACARRLPWFQPEDEHAGHVAILGGGPSLVDKIEEIQWRQSIGQDVWVLNNAHKALEGTDIWYDRQVLLDARPETASFVCPDVGEYLIASQCDPSVFAKLHGEIVTLFHVNSPGMDFLSEEKERAAYLVGGGTTVGMNAMALAFLLGYRFIHLYCFDSCYRDGAHHAYPQALNDGEPVSETLFGDKTYQCASWMVSQAREFLEVVPGYMDDGAVVTVHGKGLLPDIGLQMLGVRSPAQQRADQVLARVPPAARGVEIGVFAGQMSAALLRGDPQLQLVMVDSWESDGAAYEGDSGDWHAGLGVGAQEEFMRQAEKRVKFAGNRAAIWRSRSVEAAANFPDGVADFVFIDADHSYEGCKRDLECWFSKVKPGGWLCGHDYENVDFPKFGVTQAVNEFVEREGLELELGGNFCWFARKPS